MNPCGCVRSLVRSFVRSSDDAGEEIVRTVAAVVGGAGEQRRRTTEDEVRFFDESVVGSSWIGGGAADAASAWNDSGMVTMANSFNTVDEAGGGAGFSMSPRSGHVSTRDAGGSASERLEKGIGGLIGGLRGVETRDAARLAGVWHAVQRQSEHYDDDAAAALATEGELFVLEVGVTGVVTGRALPTTEMAAALRHHHRHHHREGGDDFEMINVRLLDGDRVQLTQVFADGSETEWHATLFDGDQMVDGRWSNRSGWSAGFTASRLPEQEGRALVATGRSVATAPSWRSPLQSLRKW